MLLVVFCDNDDESDYVATRQYSTVNAFPGAYHHTLLSLSHKDRTRIIIIITRRHVSDCAIKITNAAQKNRYGFFN